MALGLEGSQVQWATLIHLNHLSKVLSAVRKETPPPQTLADVWLIAIQTWDYFRGAISWAAAVAGLRLGLDFWDFESCGFLLVGKTMGLSSYEINQYGAGPGFGGDLGIKHIKKV
jgi:hypothetical protein